MQTKLLALATSALLLVGGVAASQAQSDRPGMMGHDGPMAGPGRGMMMEGGRGPMGGGHPMGGHPMRGPHGWGRGHGGPDMLVVMMAMIDTNGDHALSLEEVQAVHKRLFEYADEDGDGKITLEELRNFLHGGEPDSDEN